MMMIVVDDEDDGPSAPDVHEDRNDDDPTKVLLAVSHGSFDFAFPGVAGCIAEFRVLQPLNERGRHFPVSTFHGKSLKRLGCELLRPSAQIRPCFCFAKKGPNNYQYYFGGFLIIIIVYWAPKTLFKLLRPLRESPASLEGQAWVCAGSAERGLQPGCEEFKGPPGCARRMAGSHDFCRVNCLFCVHLRFRIRWLRRLLKLPYGPIERFRTMLVSHLSTLPEKLLLQSPCEFLRPHTCNRKLNMGASVLIPVEVVCKATSASKTGRLKPQTWTLDLEP